MASIVRQMIKRKGRNMSVALIKVSVAARRIAYRRKLENLSFQLIEDIATDNHEHTLETLRIVEELVRFGADIYEVEPINAKMVIEGVEELKNLVGRESGIAKPILLEDLMRRNNEPITANFQDKIEVAKNTAKVKQENQEEKKTSKKAETRHNEIIEQLRNYGKNEIQLKEIIAAFPNYSERTLRYDLKNLCEKGVIEKIGPGGPGTYYKMPEKVTATTATV
jgi:hypothetical protein